MKASNIFITFHFLLGGSGNVGHGCQSKEHSDATVIDTHPKTEVKFCVFMLLCLRPSLNSQLQCSGSHFWERAHIKIQVQGREDERRTFRACETTCEIVVCQ